MPFFVDVTVRTTSCQAARPGCSRRVGLPAAIMGRAANETPTTISKKMATAMFNLMIITLLMITVSLQTYTRARQNKERVNFLGFSQEMD